MSLDFIFPDWPAPAHIKAFSTTRHGGYSRPPFASFNLADHVGDNAADVSLNRACLQHLLPSEPAWLAQFHSNRCIDTKNVTGDCKADGSYTTLANTVAVVMTADCLPLLVCNRQGTGVAALHAGWRGLASGIIEQGIHQLMHHTNSGPEDLLVWMGPAIGPLAFEVGDEVREQFMQYDTDTRHCFNSSSNSAKWLADIYQLAKDRLAAIGVENCYGGDYCTFTQENKFFSYRRDGKTGRMASLIWMESVK